MGMLTATCSIVDTLLGMAAQVPARLVSHMGENGVNASHGNRVFENEFGPVVFFGDGIVALDGHRAQRLAPSGNAVSNGKILSHEENGERSSEGSKGNDQAAELHGGIVDDDGHAQ